MNLAALTKLLQEMHQQCGIVVKFEESGLRRSDRRHAQITLLEQELHRQFGQVMFLMRPDPLAPLSKRSFENAKLQWRNYNRDVGLGLQCVVSTLDRK